MSYLYLGIAIFAEIVATSYRNILCIRREMRQNYQLYLNILLLILIIIWSICNFSSFFLNNFWIKAEEINNYAKITAIILGIYSGIYCIKIISVDRYNFNINMTSILTVSTVMFASSSVEPDLLSTYSLTGFLFIIIGNSLIIYACIYLLFNSFRSNL